MTQEDKELLLKDLCARLPYWPHIKTEDDDDAYIVGLDDTEKGIFYVHVLEDGDSYETMMSIKVFKPYLRPMSSMTKAERIEMGKTIQKDRIEPYGEIKSSGVDNVLLCSCRQSTNLIDWLNKYHFDYRGLIDKGLALEAPEGMYKTD